MMGGFGMQMNFGARRRATIGTGCSLSTGPRSTT